MQRFGKPEEVFNATLSLASDFAYYVNGESLVINGGMTNTEKSVHYMFSSISGLEFVLVRLADRFR